MNFRVFIVHVMEFLCVKTGPQFILSSKGVAAHAAMQRSSY